MAQPQEHPAPEPADTATEAPGIDPQAALDAALAAFEVERAELRDRHIRTLADLENLRKRAEKDRREAAIYGGSKLSRDMLPVYDSLTRALMLVDDDTRERAKGLVDGLELTLRELTNIFTRHGIARITPKVGDVFDPHQHEALFEAPVPNFTAGQIIQVISDGFQLHEQLLRPAQVGVSSTPA